MSGVRRPLDTPVIEKLREREIEEARSLQRAMVPVEPIRTRQLEFACQFRPADEVGGDFLDYFWLDDKRLGFYLGDVVGKGLPAAMYAALAVGTLRGIKKTGESPTAVLQLMNKRLCMRVPPARYCAVLYGVFDPRSRQLWYANAGLPRPVRISASGCLELGEGGLPPGLFPDSDYEEQTTMLNPGDAVLFTTDGLTEAHNAGREELGLERLLEVCAQGPRGSAGDLLARVFQAADAYMAGAAQHDDMTAAVLKLA